VKTELPDALQRTLVQAERDSVEPHGRALVLKQYASIFDCSLAEAMPYIIQWELLSILRKNGNPQLWLTSSALSLNRKADDDHLTRPPFQIPLPLPKSDN